MRVEVLQWQSAELDVDLLSKAKHDPLRNSSHQVVLRPREDRAQQIHDRHEGDHLAECREVDTGTGRNRHPRQQVRLLALPVSSQVRLGLGLRHVRGQLFAHDPLKDDVGCVSQQFRSNDREEDAGNAKDQDNRDDPSLWAEPTPEAAKSCFEVARLLRR